MDHPSRRALHKFPSGIDLRANNAFFHLQAIDLYCYGSIVFNVAADFVCFVAYSPLLMFFFLLFACLFFTETKAVLAAVGKCQLDSKYEAEIPVSSFLDVPLLGALRYYKRYWM